MPFIRNVMCLASPSFAVPEQGTPSRAGSLDGVSCSGTSKALRQRNRVNIRIWLANRRQVRSYARTADPDAWLLTCLHACWMVCLRAGCQTALGHQPCLACDLAASQNVLMSLVRTQARIQKKEEQDGTARFGLRPSQVWPAARLGRRPTARLPVHGRLLVALTDTPAGLCKQPAAQPPTVCGALAPHHTRRWNFLQIRSSFNI